MSRAESLRESQSISGPGRRGVWGPTVRRVSAGKSRPTYRPPTQNVSQTHLYCARRTAEESMSYVAVEADDVRVPGFLRLGDADFLGAQRLEEGPEGLQFKCRQ